MPFPRHTVENPRSAARLFRIGGGGFAGSAVGLLDRLLRQLARLGGERGGAPLLELLAALELRGDRLQALGDLAQAGHPVGSRSRTIAPSTPLMNLGASAPQYSLAISIASLIATSWGVSPSSISNSATRITFRSSGAMRSTVQSLRRCSAIVSSSSSRASSTPSANSRVSGLA